MKPLAIFAVVFGFISTGSANAQGVNQYGQPGWMDQTTWTANPPQLGVDRFPGRVDPLQMVPTSPTGNWAMNNHGGSRDRIIGTCEQISVAASQGIQQSMDNMWRMVYGNNQGGNYPEIVVRQLSQSLIELLSQKNEDMRIYMHRPDVNVQGCKAIAEQALFKAEKMFKKVTG